MSLITSTATQLLLFIAILLFYSCSQEPFVISVSDFGAIANDGKDDAQAILKAVNACKKQKKSILVFEFVGL